MLVDLGRYCKIAKNGTVKVTKHMECWYSLRDAPYRVVKGQLLPELTALDALNQPYQLNRIRST